MTHLRSCGPDSPAEEPEAADMAGTAADTHLRIMIEQMVREGRSEESIERAVRQAA